jgi:DNA-binding MarR family transcriptional regulator
MTWHLLIQPEALDDLFLYRLSRLRSAASRRVIALCEGEFGITRREWGILGLLAKEDGILSSQLAERAQLDRARTSRAVSGLVAKKLVTRDVRPGDRREATLHLTEAGRAVNGTMFPRMAAINRELLSVLEANELAVLNATLVRLQVQADAMAPGPDGPRANRRQGGRGQRQTG